MGRRVARGHPPPSFRERTSTRRGARAYTRISLGQTECGRCRLARLLRQGEKNKAMCGIIAYAGTRPCRDILFGGLRRLEYRGYDSAGMVVLADGKLSLVRQAGNLDSLQAVLACVDPHSTVGMAHTRWATHGEPSERNAHPHIDCSGRFAIVLNGIVENYQPLREGLIREGHRFASDTDAEVVVHLLEKYYGGSLRQALARTYADLQGNFTICAMAVDEPEAIVAVRRETPLVVGLGQNETFAASSVVAFLSHTRTALFPEDGEIVEIRAEGARLYDIAGRLIERPTAYIDWDEDAAERGGYEAFMLKEIYEQPRLWPTLWRSASRSTIVSCFPKSGLVRKTLRLCRA